MKSMHWSGGLVLGVVLSVGTAWATDAAELEKFIRARIDVGEMMTNYFKGGERFGEGQRPSSEQMADMRTTINAKLSEALSKHGLTLDEYRGRSKDIFADDAAVKEFLAAHPDLKARYEALPFDRMGRGGGSTGRGY